MPRPLRRNARTATADTRPATLKQKTGNVYKEPLPEAKNYAPPAQRQTRSITAKRYDSKDDTKTNGDADNSASNKENKPVPKTRKSTRTKQQAVQAVKAVENGENANKGENINDDGIGADKPLNEKIVSNAAKRNGQQKKVKDKQGTPIKPSNKQDDIGNDNSEMQWLDLSPIKANSDAPPLVTDISYIAPEMASINENAEDVEDTSFVNADRKVQSILKTPDSKQQQKGRRVSFSPLSFYKDKNNPKSPRNMSNMPVDVKPDPLDPFGFGIAEEYCKRKQLNTNKLPKSSILTERKDRSPTPLSNQGYIDAAAAEQIQAEEYKGNGKELGPSTSTSPKRRRSNRLQTTTEKISSDVEKPSTGDSESGYNSNTSSSSSLSIADGRGGSLENINKSRVDTRRSPRKRSSVTDEPKDQSIAENEDFGMMTTITEIGWLRDSNVGTHLPHRHKSRTTAIATSPTKRQKSARQGKGKKSASSNHNKISISSNSDSGTGSSSELELDDEDISYRPKGGTRRGGGGKGGVTRPKKTAVKGAKVGKTGKLTKQQEKPKPDVVDANENVKSESKPTKYFDDLDDFELAEEYVV
ncbi:hypothetical protein H4219_001881 [Mycoemilia scoparia]|uniref:Uncharacterized protein n=1 Tax=Mycoemilia scoparia TaxID=417184 RepID=A0A9W8A2K8_9FUNG|nr:hypothetical protein H4219_001881 [Mycoemilia scoparia]